MSNIRDTLRKQHSRKQDNIKKFLGIDELIDPYKTSPSFSPDRRRRSPSPPSSLERLETIDHTPKIVLHKKKRMPDSWKRNDTSVSATKYLSPITLQTMHTTPIRNPLSSPPRRHSPEPIPNEPHFRFLVLGVGGVGKSSYLTSLLGKQIEPGYYSSSKIHTIKVNVQNTSVELVEIPGQYYVSYDKLVKEYPHPIDGFIIMYDLTSIKSTKNGFAMYEHFGKSYPHIPRVLVANKTDQLTSNKHFPGDEIVYISSAQHYNVFQPIQRLLKKTRK